MSLAVCFIIASLFYSVSLNIIYFKKSHLKNIETKLFSVMLVLNFIGLVLELSCYFLVKADFMLFASIVNRAYLIYLLAFIFLFNVYTIVLFEKSRREFRQYPHTYIHRFRQESDQGIQLDLLQNYVFVALDIFRENMHNIDISNKLDAWLTFLCVDEPEWIIKVIEAHPQFKAMYGQIYDMCLNVERVMSMFSEELRELDRNTVQYMIDEMQDEIDRMGEEIKAKKELMNHLDEQLSQKDEQLSQKDEQLSQQNEQIKALKKRISELEEK